LFLLVYIIADDLRNLAVDAGPVPVVTARGGAIMARTGIIVLTPKILDVSL